MFYTVVESPVGQLLLAGKHERLNRLSFLEGRESPLSIPTDWTRDDSGFKHIAAQLREYFRGVRKEFDIPLDIGTNKPDFSRRVWNQLRKIPYGETCSYRTIAERIGRPKAYRGSRSSQSQKSDSDRDSLPPCNWQQWNVDRIWRRTEHQRVPPQSRTITLSHL